MAVKTFWGHLGRFATNWFMKRLDDNFAELEARLNQLLHGGVYQLASDTTTTVSVTSTWYAATGTLAAVGNAYGYTPDGTDVKLTHAHPEPTGTTHYYDIDIRGHLSTPAAATISGRLQWYDSSEASTTTIWQGSAELLKGQGSTHFIWFNIRSRAAIADSDTLTLELRNDTGTEDITIYAGAAFAIRGT